MSKILIFLLLTSTFIFSQETIYHSPYLDLKKEGIYYLFGHDVAFRSQSEKNSEVIDVLKIGTEVKVIEKSEKSIDFRGKESYYYKVEHNNKTGYVLGSLISLEKKQIGDFKYFFTYGKDGERFYIIIRTLDNQNEIKELVTELGTVEFSFDLSDNKGIDGISNIVFVNYLAEACGVDGGGIYFFQTENELKKVFKIIQVSDAGVYWNIEELIFPTDKNGVKGKIVYQKELGDYKDETTNWVEISKVSRELEWKNSEILPKLNVEN